MREKIVTVGVEVKPDLEELRRRDEGRLQVRLGHGAAGREPGRAMGGRGQGRCPRCCRGGAALFPVLISGSGPGGAVRGAARGVGAGALSAVLPGCGGAEALSAVLVGGPGAGGPGALSAVQLARAGWGTVRGAARLGSRRPLLAAPPLSRVPPARPAPGSPPPGSPPPSSPPPRRPPGKGRLGPGSDLDPSTAASPGKRLIPAHPSETARAEGWVSGGAGKATKVEPPKG